MAGVSVDGGGGKGGRRALDSEINMIPMIDFLMVTISFLLITAVWTHMARINANAQVPGPPRPDQEIDKVEPEKTLHVEMRAADKFVLIWKQGSQVVSSVDVARDDSKSTETKPSSSGKPVRVVKYTDLAAKIEAEWKQNGSHRDATDKKFDQAILHTDNDAPYSNVIGVIDAIYTPKRKFQMGGRTEDVPALNVTFSVN